VEKLAKWRSRGWEMRNKYIISIILFYAVSFSLSVLVFERQMLEDLLIYNLGVTGGGALIVYGVIWFNSKSFK